MNLFILILLTGSISLAQKSNHPTKEEISVKFETYLKPSGEIGNVENDMRELVQMKLDEKTDLSLVQNALLTLVKLDPEDPSRTAVMILSEGYSKNPVLFKKAFLNIKTPENKSVLIEIENLMISFSHSGNG